MPEFGYPGLPVLSDEERKRRNALQEEWSPVASPSMDALRKLQEEEVYKRLNSGPQEPTTEELLNQAQGTLDDTALTQGALNLAAQGAQGQQPASAEALAPRPTTTYRDVAQDTMNAGSFLPGPVGLASRAGTGLLGLGDMLTEGPTMGNVLQTSAPAFDIISKFRALRSAANMAPKPTGAGAAGPFSPWERGAGRSQPRALLNANNPATQAAEDIVEGEIIPQTLMPAPRKMLTAGETWRELPAVNRAPATYADDVAEQAGRGVQGQGLQFNRPTPSNLEIEGNLLTPGSRGLGSGPSTPSNPPNTPWGASMTGLQDAAEAGGDDLTAALNALAEPSLTPEQIGAARGAERFGRNFRSEGGAPARSVPSMEGLRSETLSPDHLSALDALESMDEPSMRSVLFGGVGARNGDKFVRPSERSPIGRARLSKGRKK